MTDHLTAARRLILSASGEITSYSWAPSRTAASKAVDLISEALEHLDDALADAELGLPEGWVSVRVGLSPSMQADLRGLELVQPLVVWRRLLRDALVSQHPEPEPLQPGDIVFLVDSLPGHYVFRVEYVVNGSATITASDDGFADLVPVEDLVRLDSIPDSVDTSWHDANPIGDTP